MAATAAIDADEGGVVDGNLLLGECVEATDVAGETAARPLLLLFLPGDLSGSASVFTVS